MLGSFNKAPPWPNHVTLLPNGMLDSATGQALLPYSMHGELSLDSWWRRRVWVPTAARLLEPFDQFRDATVLEIGFGNGRMSCLFAALGASVTSVEIIPAAPAIAEARRWGCQSRVDFQQYDGDYNRLPRETYDFVFTKSTLGCSDRKNYENLIEAIANRLAPDGTALFLENVTNPMLRFYRQRFRYRRSRWDVYDFGLTRERVGVIERAFRHVEVARHYGLVWTIRART